MSYPPTVLSSHPVSRRGIGFVLVALFHVAVLVAIANGLKIPIVQSFITPTVVNIVEPERPKPVPPITTTNATLKEWTTVIPTQDPIVIEPTDTDSHPIIEAKADPIPTGMPAGKPVEIVQAKTDPRHPLTRPLYPAQAKRMGEFGTVELLLYILPNGKVQDAKISRSSGFKRLDDAAVQEALRAWRLLPMRENGVAVAGWGAIAITFRLTD